MKNKFFNINETKETMKKKNTSSLFRSKYLLAHYQKLSNLDKDLKQLPEREEFYFLQTDKQFNAFTFIPAVLKFHNIKHLYATTYSISKRVINALIELYDQGMIERLTLSISDSMISRNPTTIDLLTSMTQNRGNIKVQFSWIHAKVALMETEAGYFVVEGSGNWSENASYEQYILANSRGLFEFRKELFDNVQIRYIADSKGLKKMGT